MTNGWLSKQNPTCARKPASKIWLIVAQSCDPLSGMRRSSVRFDRFIFHPCLVRDPVDFPGLAPIIRERLLKVGRIRGDVRPNKSNQDGSAIRARWFRVEKLAASILEFADRGRSNGAGLAGGPIEAPLVGLGIVQTEGQTFDVAACRAVGFKLLQI